MGRPPLWRDVRVLRLVVQVVVLAGFVAVVLVLVTNVQRNSDRLGIPVGYGYLDNPSQTPIPDSTFNSQQPVKDALVKGLSNTLRVSVLGIVVATVLGTLIGVARLSGNWLLRAAARTYVETIRNIPLLLIVVFSYVGLAISTFPRIEDAWTPGGLAVFTNRGVVVPWLEGTRVTFGVAAVVAVGLAVAIAAWRRGISDRTGEPSRWGLWALPVVVAVLAAGWFLGGMTLEIPELRDRIITGGIRMSPEFFAIFFALVVYTSSHIAEIVRGSIQAVAKGQGEAALALALSPFQRLWYVILPQAFRIAIPPLGNQYLNLLKNSTLGSVVSYFELAKITEQTVGNGAPAVPSYALTLAIFVVVSLVISGLVNVANRRLAVPTR